MSPPPAPAKPGILIVTLHEGKGLSLPTQAEQTLNQYYQHNSGNGVAGSMRPSTSSSRTPGAMTGSYAPGHNRPMSTSGGMNAAPTVHGRYSSRYLPYALLDFDKVQVFVDAVQGNPENPLWAGDNTSFKFDVSRMTHLTIQLFLRNPMARPGAGRNDDIYLGTTQVTPRFEERRQFVDDPKASKKVREKAAAAYAEGERHLGQSGAEWLSIGYGTGSIKVGVEFVENRQKSLKIEDFDLLKVVGKGSFGKVMQVMYVESKDIAGLRLLIGCITGRKIPTGFML